MKSGNGLATHGPSAAPSADEGRANRHIPGLSDAIGDRFLIIDDRDAATVELLRFAPALASSAGFEVALRRRVQQLKYFKHAAFGSAPSVEYIGDDRTLALLSPYTPGLRLSDVVADAKGPAFACSLVQQLAPALSALHHYDGGAGHGALTASRVIISTDGRPVIVEHVLGSALERLQLTPKRMLLELGIPAPATAQASPRIDARTDLVQLALLALSLLMGRPLSVDDITSDLRGTSALALGGWDDVAAERFGWLRAWLERALEVQGHAFATTDEAFDAVPAIAEGAIEESVRRWRALMRIPRLPPADRVEAPADPAPEPASPDKDEETALVVAIEGPPFDIAELPDVPEPAAVSRSAVVAPGRPELIPLTSSPWTRRSTFPAWAIAALACLAVVEAIAIAMLLGQRRPAPAPPTVASFNLETTVPGAFVVMDGRPLGVTPLQVEIGPGVRSINVAALRPQESGPEGIIGSTGQQNLAPAAPPELPAPAAQRVGGLRVSSPIPLEVFEGDARLGSSATGIISARAGRRELDLVNSVLGFRARQVVEVKGGQVVSLTVTPPQGRININAFPWAEVLIDGKPVGETPIGNLEVPLGEHEIVFRHPQLGEHKRIAVVRADTVTRVSANLER